MTKRSASGSNRDGRDTGGKRRLLNIGPGIIIALILSVVVGYKYIVVQRQLSMQRERPPVVERQLVYSGAADKLGPTPDVGFIVDRRTKLGLSDGQMRQLASMQSSWREFYAPKIAQAKAAAEKAGSYLADAKGNRRTPVAQIQDKAAPVIALSGEISAARRDYWDRALKILTPEQRATLEKEREADWAERSKALSMETRER